MDAEADRGARPRPSPCRESTTPRRDSPRRSFSRARTSRLWTRPGRASEALRGLGQREALEVAEHDRQAGRPPAGGRSPRGGPRPARDRSPTDRPGAVAHASGRFTAPGPPRSGGAGRAGRGPCAPCGARRRRASGPAGRGRGPSGPAAPARGRRPGRRPRHAGDRRGAAGRRPAPSARAGRRSRRRRPRRRESRPAANRSMSWRSESPATEPPSKSDSSCRTTDVVIAFAMAANPPPETSVPIHPLAGYCPDARRLVRGFRPPESAEHDANDPVRIRLEICVNPPGFSTRISPRSSVSPGLTVKSLRIWIALVLDVDGGPVADPVRAPGIRAGRVTRPSASVARSFG